MRFILYFAFFVCFYGQTTAQKLDEIPRFGDFSDVDWREFRAPIDSIDQFWAFKSRDIRIDVGRSRTRILFTDRQRLIVQKTEFPSFPLLQIPLYTRDSVESLHNFRVRVQQIGGLFFDFDSEDIQQAELNDRYILLQFIVDNVIDSSIVDIEYQINRRYVEEIPAYVFADRIPILHNRLKLQNSPFLLYKTIPENMGPLTLQHFTQQRDTSGSASIFSVNMMTTLREETYWVDGIPGWPNEPLAPEFREYAPQIKFLWTEFGSPRQPLEQSWPVIAAEAQKRFKYNSLLEKRVKALEKSPLKKNLSVVNTAENIRKQFFYDGQKGIIPTHFGKDSVEFASQADINMELVARARKNGMSANVAFVSSSISIDSPPQLPNLLEFSSLIAHIDGQFFDGIHQDLSVQEFQDQWAFILVENTYEWKKIPKYGLENPSEFTLKAILDKEDKLTAELTIPENGEFFLDWLGPEIQAFPKNAESKNAYTLEGQKSLISFADGADVFALPIFGLFNDIFENDLRIAPISIPEILNVAVNYSIELPRGYKLEDQNMTRSISNEAGNLSFSARQNKNVVTFRFELNQHQKIAPAQMYPSFKELYKAWFEISTKRWRIVK